MIYTESLQQRLFEVKSGNIDSKYVTGYELTKNKLTIRTTVPRDKSIKRMVEHAEFAVPITIELLNERRDVVETITITDAKLVDWKVDATNRMDTPQYALLELRLIYDIIRMD